MTMTPEETDVRLAHTIMGQRECDLLAAKEDIDEGMRTLERVRVGICSADVEATKVALEQSRHARNLAIIAYHEVTLALAHDGVG